MTSSRSRRLYARRIARPPFSIRFSFRHLSSPLSSANKLLVIALGLVAGAVLLSGLGTATTTLRNNLSSSSAASLDRKLATEFPILTESMAARTTEFDKAMRRVDGREVRV